MTKDPEGEEAIRYRGLKESRYSLGKDTEVAVG